MSIVTVTSYDYKQVFYAVDYITYDDYGNLVIKFKEEGHVTYIPRHHISQVDVR